MFFKMNSASSLLPEYLEHKGMILRRWEPGDEAVLSCAIERNVEHLRPWMPWIAEEPLNLAKRRVLIEEWERAWRQGGDVVLGVFDGTEVAGGCGLHRRRGPFGLDIGYWIDKDHLRRGLGTEIARVLTTTALLIPGVTFTEIHHDKANIASGRIPRRLGYDFVGESIDGKMAPGEVGIDWAWRMESADWNRLRQNSAF
jgi:RimJ/RimL family protein N-acetyltransferase